MHQNLVQNYINFWLTNLLSKGDTKRIPNVCLSEIELYYIKNKHTCLD
jgi:hypothetical protein